MNNPRQSRPAGSKTKRGRKRKGANSPISKKAIEARKRQAEALNYRLQGWSLQAIADILGYAGTAGAYKAIITALQATIQEPADELRKIHHHKLQALWLKAWSREDVQACLKVLAREAKLHGLDAPEQHEVELRVHDKTDEEIDALYIADLRSRGYKVVPPK